MYMHFFSRKFSHSHWYAPVTQAVATKLFAEKIHLSVIGSHTNNSKIENQKDEEKIEENYKTESKIFEIYSN